MERLDEKDRLILYELSHNARRPSREIAKTIGISEQVLNYRIKKLMEKGIISGFTLIPGIDAFGMRMFRCMFRLENADEKKEQEITRYILSCPGVFYVSRALGSWELFVNMIAPDHDCFCKTVRGCIEKFPDNLRSYLHSSFISSEYFGRSYLKENAEKSRTFLLDSSGRKESVDKRDIAILAELFKDARIPNLEIARRTRLALNTVKSRIGSMETRGIIRAYIAFIHTQFFGSRKKILIKSIQGFEAEKRLGEFCTNHPNIYKLEKFSGRWDFEVVIECMKEEEFRSVMKSLKNALEGISFEYEVADIEYNSKTRFEKLLDRE